jgi:hypothetical protein
MPCKFTPKSEPGTILFKLKDQFRLNPGMLGAFQSLFYAGVLQAAPGTSRLDQ